MIPGQKIKNQNHLFSICHHAWIYKYILQSLNHCEFLLSGWDCKVLDGAVAGLRLQKAGFGIERRGSVFIPCLGHSTYELITVLCTVHSYSKYDLNRQGNMEEEKK